MIPTEEFKFLISDKGGIKETRDATTDISIFVSSIIKTMCEQNISAGDISRINIHHGFFPGYDVALDKAIEICEILNIDKKRINFRCVDIFEKIFV